MKTITYRRICHAPSHLIRASVGSGAVPSRKAPRRRHFHFIGWIHRHCAHAATRRKIFLKLQRFGGAFEGSWRINFVGFRLHFRGKKWILSSFDGWAKEELSRGQNSLHTFLFVSLSHELLLSKFHFHFIIVSISLLWVSNFLARISHNDESIVFLLREQRIVIIRWCLLKAHFFPTVAR